MNERSKESADAVRKWTDELNLSDTEAAEALSLNNPDVIIREYKSGKRTPGSPTLQLMEHNLRIVEALVQLRSGKAFDARRTLESMMTLGLRREIERRLGKDPDVFS